MKRLLIICAIMASLLGAPSVLAAGQTVAVNPNPVAMDAPATVSGCGYRQGEQLWVGTVVGGNYAFAGSDGCFSFSRTFSLAGTITVIVYDAANGKVKSKALAATSVAVT